MSILLTILKMIGIILAGIIGMTFCLSGILLLFLKHKEGDNH